ncbi:ABC transporter permease [Mesorhizobium sp. CA7]|uniref:ABC transporter permease n=1 Tax=Mesorhizobium sp. CA7 TaxID=588501 RepID=UPI001CCDC0A0|nr:ABC transporter permease subunit [Mesorhizobium sp. CA7]MBZ9816027.1 ABC transporter permease subunit [Mesorhizobium sp. CA7]
MEFLNDLKDQVSTAYELLAAGWGVQLLWGIAWTLAVTVVSMLIGAVLGSLVAAAKLSHRGGLRFIGESYTTVFRGEPELLIIYLFYYGGTQILTGVARSTGSIGSADILNMPSFLGGVLAVGIISGAYQAEVFRGSFLAIHRGELEAARAYGMSAWLRFRLVIMPQVLRLAVPGLGNVWQLTIKDSALISVTGVAELMLTANKAARSTHHSLLFYTLAGILYLAMTSISTPIFDKAERYTSRSFTRPK